MTPLVPLTGTERCCRCPDAATDPHPETGDPLCLTCLDEVDAELTVEADPDLDRDLAREAWT